MTRNARRLAVLVGLLALAPSGALRAADETTTPIKHVVVIFQENISFDHYFGTYPNARNAPGEPRFLPKADTPTVNGLSAGLLTHNPNRANPFRLAPSEAVTCDMDHEYKAEQEAFDGGLMDKFVEYTSTEGHNCPPNGVMGYFDGNTVTALWNYAQHFALNDNSFGTGFGPSTPGAINLVSGNTHGVSPAVLAQGKYVLTSGGTMIGDPDPQFDDCSNPGAGMVAMQGVNIADLLNAKHIRWGWFQGGFKPTATLEGRAVCGAKSTGLNGAVVTDYSAHHEPFQYYPATANPHHLPPTSVAMIGASDQANHQYDLTDFDAALTSGHLPAVNFLKAKKYQDGHAGYSNPIDEQSFLVDVINRIEKTPYWKNTAIIIAYDDSDGWYDHVMPPILNGSAEPNLDALNGPGKCGTATAGGFPGRCGYGPRLPLLVVSPYARPNFVDHNLTDQTSIIRFIEDNWSLGRIGNQSMDEFAGSLSSMFAFDRPHAHALFLDGKTGQPEESRFVPARK